MGLLLVLAMAGSSATRGLQPGRQAVHDAPRGGGLHWQPRRRTLAQPVPPARPPVAAKRPKKLSEFGDVRVDDYYWLRDDTRKSPEVINYLKQENAYTQAALADTKETQELLSKELRDRIKEDDSSVPVRYRGYWYYARIGKGQQYKVHCRKMVPKGAPPPDEKDAPAGFVMGEALAGEEVLLDENKRKEEGKHEFYMVADVSQSPDSKLLAWTEDVVGREKYSLRVKDISTGRELTDPIPNTDGSVVWANDNATLFYVTRDEQERPYRVFRHKLGTPVSQDALVYEERDEAFTVSIGKSTSEKLILIIMGSSITSEVRYLKADDPLGGLVVVWTREHDVEYGVDHHPGAEGEEGWFLISRRSRQTPNQELIVAPVTDPQHKTVVLAHRRDVQLEGAAVSQRYIVVNERANAMTRVVLHKLAGKGARPGGPLGKGDVITFDEDVYTLSGGMTGEFSGDVLRLAYESMTTPTSVIDLFVPTGNRATRKVSPVLGGFKKENYHSERLWATAPDGVRVPISLVYRTSLFKKGQPANLLLDGYGAYGMSNDPQFDRNGVSLLDRGWILATAHIRGGGDMGRLWYEDGKFLKKKNTFTDFIACAEHLVKSGYTAPEHLAIVGRSAGGMTMGAVLNMRPDLFGAAIAGVPFVDVLTTMLDETIPLTTMEYEEWGNPHQKDYYYYMKSYSPMDNVKAQRYPAMLVIAGLHDPRVQYWEPAKWVAKLRSLKAGNSTLLLKTEMGAGHFSVTGRFERLKETALEYAFLMKAAGQQQQQQPAAATPAGPPAGPPAAAKAPAAAAKAPAAAGAAGGRRR